jgi:hypothetical protein
MKRLTVSLLVLVTVLSLSGLVFAQENPDATLKLTKGQVAAGVGWSWGGGVLTYKGTSYSFKVSGLSVGDVGITKATAVGDVFHLNKLSDFNGTYSASAAEGTVGAGAGVETLQNENGVVIRLQSTTKGVNFKIALEGMKITLKEK